MTRLPFALAAGALLLTTTACGGGGEEEPSGQASESASESASPSESASASASEEPTTEAAGECAGDTQELEGADGVALTVPADWTVESLGDGEDTRFVAPDGDAGEGQLVVQANGQSIEEGVSDAERLSSQAEKTADEEVELPGFDAARQLTFEFSSSTSTTVVAVSGELRVIAYTIVEDAAPDALPVAAACMLTLERQG